jgi:hypothetical protein
MKALGHPLPTKQSHKGRWYHWWQKLLLAVRFRGLFAAKILAPYLTTSRPREAFVKPRCYNHERHLQSRPKRGR